MELILYEPKETVREFRFNYEELKAELSAKMGHYLTMVYTVENLSEARDDRALLNKTRKAIDDRRREVRRRYLRPYEEFEEKVKELLQLIDAPAAEIDGQIKAYEGRLRGEKRDELAEFYRDAAGDVAALVPADRLFEPRWLKAAFPIRVAKGELLCAAEKFRAEMAAIGALSPKYAAQVKDVYLKTLDLSCALRESVRMERQEERLKAFGTAEREAEELTPVCLRLWATEEQLGQLSEYLKRGGIKYEKTEGLG